MGSQLTKAIDQSLPFVSTLNLRQKIVLGVSLVAALGVFGVSVHLMGNGDLKTLYSGLPPAEAQEISRRLGAKDIRYELSKDGTAISVPAGRVDDIRMQLAPEVDARATRCSISPIGRAVTLPKK